ncbi:MAG: TonB-dependent receptor [Ponticaulis sp.]|nr:TonB-dependent receptor [Ponticaulis sp.]|tara:strand:+ start:14560 stop:16656 length:2097 start_codon:yes stop_codon:yes gene_type:complete
MKLSFNRALACGVAGLAMAAPVCAQSDTPALQDVIIVTGKRQDTQTETALSTQTGLQQGGDVTYLTARTPGGARIANGEMSGQMQYRGLFGERLNLRVNGMRFASGGPNLMDPALSYAPAPLVAQVVIDRGISPVSAGPGLAGGADAIFKKIDYTNSDDVRFGHDVSMGLRSVNNSITMGGVAGASTDSWRFNLLGAFEKGSDTNFPDGVIGGSEYQRSVFGLSTGLITAAGEFTLEARRQTTDPSGNPPFPMDIQFVDTDFYRLGYAKDFGEVQLKAAAYSVEVEHLMDNFSLRPAPPAMRQRQNYTSANTKGIEASLTFGFAGGELEVGGDGELVDHNARISNPNNANFFVTPFPEVDFERFGGFAEWTGGLGFVEAELGARVDGYSFDAGPATLGTALPMMPRNLAAAFNAADKSGEETQYDLVARFWTPEENGLSWRATFARKHQMPGYIQRYGWLPINASGGLADGNIYVGDLDLDAEIATSAEVGFDYAASNFYARPSVFVRQIDDYIQGVPFDDTPGVINSPVEMVANMNGDPTPLRWANVDARLYGFDLDAGYDFAGPLRLDGVFNYVRGERRDIDDNLYRIAPPNLALGLSWKGETWMATLETRAFAEQDEVSLTNSEATTEGYVVFNAYVDWDIREGVHLSAGIENLFSEDYQDHLAGYNRNGFGDVPVGQRVPGPGRGAFVRLSLAH